MRYYIERTIQAIVTYVAAITLAFVLYRMMPGGPVQAMRAQLIAQAAEAGQTVDIERINSITERRTGIDPDAPIHEAYIDYMSGVVFELDLGTSIALQRPVTEVLFQAMPWSIFVSVYGLLLGYTVTILLGSLMAYLEGSKFDSGSTVTVLLMQSVPYYVVAVLLLATLAFQYGWFPTGGRYNQSLTPGFNITFMGSVVYHAALPILTGFIVGFGGGALAMRANAIRVIGSEYLYSARLRGISTSRITTRYVARNAVLPIYTGMMIGVSAIFSSSVIMEYIFTYPGVGWYTFGALESRDYPLLMGAFIFFTAITLLGILIADFTYGLIDPRAGTGADRETF